MVSHNKEDIKVLCDQVYEMGYEKLTIFKNAKHTPKNVSNF